MRLQALLIILLLICAEGAQLYAAQQKGSTARTKQAANSVDFEKLKAQAEAARDTDQIPEAIALYGRLVGLRPNWAEGWWHLGAMRYERDQYADAEKAFAKYVVLEPEIGQGWAMIGLCEYRNNKLVSSLQNLAKARKLGLGGNQELARVVRYHEALLLIRGLQFEAALKILEVFTLEHLESPPVLEAMGMAVLRIPELPESLKAEQREMARQFGKAAFLAFEHKQSESLQLYEKLETTYRGTPNVAYAMGIALVAQGENERAVAQFKKELERDPKHLPAILQVSLADISMRKFAEALDYATKAVMIDQGYFAGYYAQGRVYLYLNDLPHAIAMLEKAGSLAPNSAPVFYTLAQAYQRANRPEDAARARAAFARLEENEKNRKDEVNPERSTPAEKPPGAVVPPKR
jgi:tetratricopeptide (TPR) repeat protein